MSKTKRRSAASHDICMPLVLVVQHQITSLRFILKQKARPENANLWSPTVININPWRALQRECIRHGKVHAAVDHYRSCCTCLLITSHDARQHCLYMFLIVDCPFIKTTLLKKDCSKNWFDTLGRTYIWCRLLILLFVRLRVSAIIKFFIEIKSQGY